MKSKFVRAEDMDFVTGVDEVIADTYDEPPPKNIWEKFWLWIVSTLNPPFFNLLQSVALLARVYSSSWPRTRCIGNVFKLCSPNLCKTVRCHELMTGAINKHQFDPTCHKLYSLLGSAR